MNKNLSKIYTVVVVIALILLGAWSAWDVYQLRTDNTEAAQLNIDKIKNTVEKTYNSGTPFNDTEFFNVIRTLFSDNQELELLTIFSHDTGIEYYYNRGEETILLNQDETNQLTWESLPEYKYNQLMKTRLNRNLTVMNRTGIDMDIIYQVVDRITVYNILIRLLIVVVILFFTTLLMIFILSKSKEESTIILDEEDDFEEDTDDNDEMDLNWDDNSFNLPEQSKKSEKGLSDPDLEDDFSSFGDLDLDDSDFNLDDNSDFGDLNLDGENDMETDLSFDDIDSDFPEEEDLMAMDHEISPSSDLEEYNFDEIDDSFIEDDTKSLYSPKSGVGWEDFIEERVNLELERAASFDQDLVMGIIQCENLSEENYKLFADELKNDFNYPDMIFEYKDNGFAIIVPNTDLDSALKTLENFAGKEESDYGDICVGISSRNGRLITGSRIFMEAENALNKAVEDEEKNIVGFRSDPEKFRNYLSGKK
jgi:hypothetical protein